MRNSFEMRVRTRPLKLSGASSRALARADSYDWLLFTSKHAATYFVNELRTRGMTIPKTASIGAVGPATAHALRKLGLRPHVVPKTFTARDLAHALRGMKGARVLFPRSALARSDAVHDLRKRGAVVRTIALYTTEAVPLSASEQSSLARGKYERLIFKSPSGVKGLLRQLSVAQRNIVLGVPARCIGPTTAAAARKAGFKKVSVGRIL